MKLSMFGWQLSKGAEKPAAPAAKRKAPVKRAHPSEDPSSWLSLAGTDSQAGPAVTDSSAMTLAAVFGAVKILSEDVSSMPLKLYRRGASGKETASDHPLYTLLHDAPNPEMSSVDMRMAMTAWMCLRGNGYAEIERDGAGRIKYLWPLHTPSMWVRRLDGKLRYLYTLPNGQQASLFADEVLHVRGLSLDGICGLAPIGYARENIGLGLAAQEYGARLFSANSVPKGVIEATGKFKDEEVLQRFKRQVEESHQGLTKAHRIMILENGMKWHQTGLPPEDAQFLELRKFGVEDIARFFRLEASKLQIGDKRAFASVEQDSLNHVIFTLRPWYVFWEQAISRALLSPAERATMFAEHLVDGFLRGDIATRYEAHVKALTNGFSNIDEVREIENKNPLPDGLGKGHRVPLNTMELGSKPASVGAPEPAKN